MDGGWDFKYLENFLSIMSTYANHVKSMSAERKYIKEIGESVKLIRSVRYPLQCTPARPYLPLRTVGKTGVVKITLQNQYYSISGHKHPQGGCFNHSPAELLIIISGHEQYRFLMEDCVSHCDQAFKV